MIFKIFIWIFKSWVAKYWKYQIWKFKIGLAKYCKVKNWYFIKISSFQLAYIENENFDNSRFGLRNCEHLRLHILRKSYTFEIKKFPNVRFGPSNIKNPRFRCWPWNIWKIQDLACRILHVQELKLECLICPALQINVPTFVIFSVI